MFVRCVLQMARVEQLCSAGAALGVLLRSLRHSWVSPAGHLLEHRYQAHDMAKTLVLKNLALSVTGRRQRQVFDAETAVLVLVLAGAVAQTAKGLQGCRECVEGAAEPCASC